MFWFMNKLAQDYDTELKISPKVKSSLSGIYSTMADNTLYVQIRASGFFILSKKFSDNHSLTIDIKDSPEGRHKKTLKIATVGLKDKIRDSFDKNVQILSIDPDTIYFDRSEYVIKTVPVKGDFSLSFKNEYRQSASTRFFPDSVTIAGSNEHVAGIKSVSLSAKKYEDIDETLEGISNIVARPNIYVDPSKIRYKIPVERCTEGDAYISLKTVNVPDDSKLILLPATVHIKYVVPLKDYSAVSVNDFRAEVDFNDTRTSLNRYVKVRIVQRPSPVFDLKVEPAFVEFLIHK
jgi:hypothetical protein